MKKITNDEHIAEEITSEAFFKALNAVDSFRGDCNIRVWLCQIAKNCYFTYLKKQKKNADFNEIEEKIDEIQNTENAVIAKDQSMRIQMIIHNLDQPYKEVFSLRTFAELSFKDIGHIFNKSENWACVTYHRAKAIIRKELDKNERK